MEDGLPAERDEGDGGQAATAQVAIIIFTIHFCIAIAFLFLIATAIFFLMTIAILFLIAILLIYFLIATLLLFLHLLM